MANSLVSTHSGSHQRALVAPAPPTQRELVLRVVPMPADVNASGDIFGGWVMAQVDIGGSVLPMRIAQGRIATVAVNQFIFKDAQYNKKPADTAFNFVLPKGSHLARMPGSCNDPVPGL